MSLKIIAAVAAGGALGTLLRYIINLAVLPSGYPYGTIIENTGGSFILGGVTAWFLTKKAPEWVKVGIGTGFCGGLTTMSTLASDTVMLAARDASAPVIYLGMSIFGGLAAALIGFYSVSFLLREKGGPSL
jgi:fluoride exporter